MWPLFENEIYCALYPVFTGQLQNLWNIDVDVDRNIDRTFYVLKKTLNLLAFILKFCYLNVH